tara:strand:- start:462 stop:962 length:501 start_codon:yes stop_codon:yes gene_type:complete
MNQNFNPQEFKPLIIVGTIVIIVLFFLFSIIYTSPGKYPKIYAFCPFPETDIPRWHITLEDGYINILESKIVSSLSSSMRGFTYKVNRRSRSEDRVSFRLEDRRCKADWYNDLYPNPMYWFEWNLESKTAKYRSDYYNCKILPHEEMPDGFEFPNKRSVHNVDTDC